jgi:RimJ/RimL family protein N-acetyltransferase
MGQGGRVVLRVVREDDLAAIEGWFDEAAKTAGIPHRLPISRSAGEGRSVDARPDGVLVIERIDEGGPIGLLEYEMKKRWLTVPFIALAKAYRGWGYGSEAVRLLELWAIREGLAERFRAEVDVRNGLGLYFWLRLGYRPLVAVEAQGRDVLTMVRDAGKQRN